MCCRMPRLFPVISFLLLATPVFAQVPGAPQGLASSVSGNTVTLTWSAPSSGGAATGYVVEAAVVPGGAVVASLPVANTTLTVPNVPSGNYYVRVRGINGSGAGVPSSEVVVSVSGGCPGPPLPPALLVRSIGFEATVSWGSSGGCAPTSYTLFAGSAPGLSDVTVVNAGGQLGLGAIAPPGVYYVRVLGTNAYGSAMSQELVVRVAANAQTDTVSPNGAVAIDVTMTRSGTYSGSLIWSDPAIDLDLYLTTPGCSYPPVGCLLAISDTTGSTVENVSRTVAAGESYRLWVDNFSSQATSFTIFNNVVSDLPMPASDVRTGEEPGEAPIRKIKP